MHCVTPGGKISLKCAQEMLITIVTFLPLKLKLFVFVFQLSEEGPCEESSGDGQLSIFNEWILPAMEFDGMWERFV